jgi:hypothetical protein
MNTNAMLNTIRRGTVADFLFKLDLLPYSVNGFIAMEHLLLREHFKLCLSVKAAICDNFVNTGMPGITRREDKLR